MRVEPHRGEQFQKSHDRVVAAHRTQPDPPQIQHARHHRAGHDGTHQAWTERAESSWPTWHQRARGGGIRAAASPRRRWRTRRHRGSTATRPNARGIDGRTGPRACCGGRAVQQPPTRRSPRSFRGGRRRARPPVRDRVQSPFVPRSRRGMRWRSSRARRRCRSTAGPSRSRSARSQQPPGSQRQDDTPRTGRMRTTLPATGAGTSGTRKSDESSSKKTAQLTAQSRRLTPATGENTCRMSSVYNPRARA